MKFIGLLSILMLLTFGNPAQAQSSENIEIGDMLKIGNSDNYQYSYVNFPRPNFIIKKGGIANYKKLAGAIVEVTEVKIDDNGETVVHFKRRDGKKFFGSFSQVSAHYEKAIAAKELNKIKA